MQIKAFIFLKKFFMYGYFLSDSATIKARNKKQVRSSPVYQIRKDRDRRNFVRLLTQFAGLG